MMLLEWSRHWIKVCFGDWLMIILILENYVAKVQNTSFMSHVGIFGHESWKWVICFFGNLLICDKLGAIHMLNDDLVKDYPWTCLKIWRLSCLSFISFLFIIFIYLAKTFKGMRWSLFPKYVELLYAFKLVWMLG